MRSDGRLVSSSTSPPPPVRDMRILSKSPWQVIVSQVFVLCALRVLGQYLVYAHRCLSRSLPLAHLVKVIRCSATFTLRPVTLLCDAPSTGKSQVLLCAATFKFRGHLSIVFSWSLAFSRPKNGPDRTAGRSSTAETVFHRSLTHAASRRRRHQVSEGAPSPLAPAQVWDMRLSPSLHSYSILAPQVPIAHHPFIHGPK